MDKRTLCVLVSEEKCGDGKKTFVAQTIEFDVATQVSPGDSILDVVEALGTMWDAHDAIYEQEPNAIQPPPAPLFVYNQWLNESLYLGRLPLGQKRVAEVKILK